MGLLPCGWWQGIQPMGLPLCSKAMGIGGGGVCKSFPQGVPFSAAEKILSEDMVDSSFHGNGMKRNQKASTTSQHCARSQCTYLISPQFSKLSLLCHFLGTYLLLVTYHASIILA